MANSSPVFAGRPMQQSPAAAETAARADAELAGMAKRLGPRYRRSVRWSFYLKRVQLKREQGVIAD